MQRLWFLVVSGCIAELGSPEELEPHELARVEDSFACYRPEALDAINGGYSCSGSPNLSASTLCREGASASYHVVHVPTATEMTMGVIAPHGGAIEPGTDDIAFGLAEELGLPHYVFVAHASDRCLDKYGGADRSNRRALHITSVHFNDARAEKLMRAVNRGVSIHGHGGPNKICVGGITPALRAEFMRYFTTYTARHSPSGALAVDATRDSDCGHITGTSPRNISNRTAAGHGLQLELSRPIRDELVASRAGNRTLWISFRNAVRAACRVRIDGVRGCA